MRKSRKSAGRRRGLGHRLRSFLYSAGVVLTGHANILKHFREIVRLESSSREEIEKYQVSRINIILEHAYKTTDYYRKTFDRMGLKPRISRLSDLKRFPILTKKALKENLKGLTSSAFDAKDLIRNASGGSTGVPTVFYQDRDYFDFSVAYQNFLWHRMGYRYGDGMAYLWGSDRDYSLRRLRDKVNEVVLNRMMLNTFDATEEDLVRFAHRLRRFRPKILTCYASSLYQFAKVVSRNGIRGIRPDIIQSSAETLQGSQRKLIEKVFRTRVYNSYGSREVGSMAHECRMHKGLHESFQMNYVELVDGKVVVTNLRNLATPFIRYKIGDVGIGIDTKKCRCGLRSKRIMRIVGRTSDIIRTPEGKTVHGEYFTHLFYGWERVERFQVVQETLSQLRIIIQGRIDGNEKEKLESWIRKKIDDEVSREFRLKFEYVKAIKPEKSGKFRFTISRLDDEKAGRGKRRRTGR